MDTGGQTVSATEFAGLTGISRERLRTWERRFGFPEPVRIAHGPRRYTLADAPRVVAVRRAAEQGVPLPQAIADVAVVPAEPVSPAILAAAAELAPTPIVLVSGPEPLRVVYVNAPLRVARDGIAPGHTLDTLPWFTGSDLERTLHTLFAGTAQTLECRHPSWTGTDGIERSIAYRLPPSPRAAPLLALIGVDRTEEHHALREVSELRHELAVVRDGDQRHERWLALAASLAERFQRDADSTLVATVTSTVARGLGAVDAGIGVYMSGEVALGSSSRGMLGPRMVTVTGYDDLATILHTGVPGWLAAATGRAFGTPPSLHTLAVPIVVVGETLGVLLLVFDEPNELEADARRLLTVISAGLGFTLLRDRLVASGKNGAT